MQNDEMQKLTHLKQWLAFYQREEEEGKKSSRVLCVLHCIKMFFTNVKCMCELNN